MLELLGLETDWSSTDFANNVDELFNRKVLGAAFVTYAANKVITHVLGMFVTRHVVFVMAWLLVFTLTIVLFAYWDRVMGG